MLKLLIIVAVSSLFHSALSKPQPPQQQQPPPPQAFDPIEIPQYLKAKYVSDENAPPKFLYLEIEGEKHNIISWKILLPPKAEELWKLIESHERLVNSTSQSNENLNLAELESKGKELQKSVNDFISVLRKNKTDQSFAEFDKNKDGKIDQEEFKNWSAKQLKGHIDENAKFLEEQFSFIDDSPKDEKVTKEEFMKSLVADNFVLPHQTKEQAFNEISGAGKDSFDSEGWKKYHNTNDEKNFLIAHEYRFSEDDADKSNTLDAAEWAKLYSSVHWTNLY